MTPYDVAMIGVVVAGMVWGAWRGITWQVASIASLVLGYVVAFPLSAQLAPYCPGEPLVARGLGLLISYVGVSGGVFLVAWTIRRTLRKLRFEAYDRHLGMILGGVEGGIVGLVATILVVSLSPGLRGPILTSPTGRLVDRGFKAARPALPGELQEVLQPFWAALEGRPAQTPAEALAGAAGDLIDRAADDPANGEALRGAIEEHGRRVGRSVVDEVERSLGVARGESDAWGRGAGHR